VQDHDRRLGAWLVNDVQAASGRLRPVRRYRARWA